MVLKIGPDRSVRLVQPGICVWSGFGSNSVFLKNQKSKKSDKNRNPTVWLYKPQTGVVELLVMIRFRDFQNSPFWSPKVFPNYTVLFIKGPKLNHFFAFFPSQVNQTSMGKINIYGQRKKQNGFFCVFLA